MNTFFSIVLFILAALPSYGAVSLSMASSTQVIQPGGGFDVNVRVISSGDPITGVHLGFLTSEEDSFTLVSRDLAGSSFPDVYTPDLGMVLSGEGAADLGADIPDIFSPLFSGNYQVAKFHIVASDTLLPGQYTLSLTGLSGYYPDQGDTQLPYAISLTGNYITVTVPSVPEPTGLLLLLPLLLWRRRAV